MTKPGEPANPAGEPSNEPDNTPPAEGGEDYAGYASLDDMRKAIYESRKEGKKLAEQNAQLAAYVTRLAQPQTTEDKSEADELGALGIPVEALERLIDKRAEAKFASQMAPVQRTQEAYNDLRSSNPQFVKSEADFNRWLSANPDIVTTYNQSVAESPRSANILLRGVFAEYEQSRRSVASPAAEPKKVGSDARLPNMRGSGSARSDKPEQIGRDDMKDLIKNARRTGSPVELMRALLGDKPIHRDIERKQG